jgi:hypothetical protein
MKVPGSIAFDIESWAAHIPTEAISHKNLHLALIESALVLVERSRAGTQRPFFGFGLFFLTNRRNSCQNVSLQK